MSPHVQVILGDDTVPPGLEVALLRAGATASYQPLASALRDGVATTGDAVILVAPPDRPGTESRLRVLLHRMAEQPRAMLVLGAAGRAPAPVPHPALLPVTYAADTDADELTRRLVALLQRRSVADADPSPAHGAPGATQAPLAQAPPVPAEVTPGPAPATPAQRLRPVVEQASRVQRHLVAHPLPALAGWRFAALYRPVDFVSGDLYDVRRLDDEHAGMFVADAAGHGLPAALLTVFIRRALHGQEAHAGRPRVLPPQEVLARLNTDLLASETTEFKFVAVSYAVVHPRSRQVDIARGGAPYPLLRRADGRVSVVKPVGGVVGAVPGMEFGVEAVQLEPGDALLLLSDGVEAVLAEGAGTLRGPAGGRPDEALLATPWCAGLSRDGVEAALEALAALHTAQRAQRHALDDLTVLAVEAIS